MEANNQMNDDRNKINKEDKRLFVPGVPKRKIFYIDVMNSTPEQIKEFFKKHNEEVNEKIKP